MITENEHEITVVIRTKYPDEDWRQLLLKMLGSESVSHRGARIVSVEKHSSK